MNKTNKILRSTLIAIAIICLTVCGATLKVPQKVSANPELVYKLDFSDSTDYSKNTSGSSIAGATLNGNLTYTENAIKGKTAVNLPGGMARTNYIKIPGEVLNNESITVAGWFKIPSDVGGWTRLIEINNGSNSYLSVMPYAPNYYNALHINTQINGVTITGADNADNMLHEGGDPAAAINTPNADYVLPVYDAWVHYAYQLTPTAFNLYQNGKLVKALAGNFTASQFYSENSSIALGATLISWLTDGDIKASYADLRVYASALTEEQIVSEYALTYSDFLTASYDFENGTQESVRGYNGTLTGTASVENNVLVIDGGQVNDDWSTRSGMTIPSKILHGHDSVTIAMDLYVDSSCGGWARIFEFASVWNVHWCIAAKWGSSTNVAMKHTNNNDNNDQFMSGEFVFDKWVHFVAVIDGNVAKLYIDGQVIATATDFEYKNSIFWEGNSAMQFGRTIHHNDRPLVGKMDNIKIYSTALTEREVLIEAGVITILDDGEAIASEKAKLEISYGGTGSKIDLPSYVGEGVKVSWESSNQDVVTNAGDVLNPQFETEVVLTATLTRGSEMDTKQFTVTVKAVEIKNPSIVFSTSLDAVSFEQNSYYEGLMETNLDYMMSLNTEKLLYNYRRLAGLDTKGASSYGAWISPTSGGAGQFESHYMIALAKACQTMPNYEYNGETVLDRLTYMLTELEKCQDAYALLKPDDAGYLGAISADHYHAIEEGRTTTDDGANIWVPWYFAHKTVEMLLDVYNYASSPELQAKAWEMLMDYSDWASYMTTGRSNDVRLKILRVEYGGMSEVYYQIYGITRQAKHYNVAKFFEEDPLLNNVYENKDVLAGLHSNTAIPKFLGCAAAYEVTGDEYYKTVCINAFEMIMTRTYANGGTSRGEHWQEAGSLQASNESCETCCSYNMLKLADYLYRWTGDKKYLDYADLVYTNHILASMAPDTGLKTYLTNTAFGYYKIYHTVDNSFWCCTATGLESFAKLPQGIYYTDANGVKVNSFYPSTFKVSEDLQIVQSGNFFADQKTTFTINGGGEFTLSLRLPSWAEKGFTVAVNGVEQLIEQVDGFINLTRNWQDGDKVEYALPFTFRLDILKGSTRTYALHYGPMLLVADLGNDDVHDVQGSQLTFGSAYAGPVSNKIVLDGTFDTATQVICGENGAIEVLVNTLNQGQLTFKPFNQVFHSRYGMYFDYYESMEEIDKDYTVKGNEYVIPFDSQQDLDLLREYSTTGAKSHVENGVLVTPVSGEHKYMADLSMALPYVVQLSVAPYDKEGNVNGGVYLFASNVAKDADQIKAYNVQIEKDPKLNNYRISVFKFDAGYLGMVTSVNLVLPESGVIDLHILVREDKCFVYVGTSRNIALEFSVDKSFIENPSGLDVGIRSQFSSMRIDNFKIISSQFTEVGVKSLENAIAMAGEVNQNKFTPATYEIFKAKYATALEVMANAQKTQEMVNSADKELRTAINDLVLRGNPSALNVAISAVNALDSRNYTQASWEALGNIVNKLIALDLTVCSEEEIAGYEELVKNALFALELKYSEKQGLNALIEMAENLVSEDYTQESWAKFSQVLESVKALGDITATQEDEACIKLLNAQLQLVEKAPVIDGNQTSANDLVGCTASVFGSSSVAVLVGLVATLILRKKKD